MSHITFQQGGAGDYYQTQILFHETQKAWERAIFAHFEAERRRINGLLSVSNLFYAYIPHLSKNPKQTSLLGS